MASAEPSDTAQTTETAANEASVLLTEEGDLSDKVRFCSHLGWISRKAHRTPFFRSQLYDILHTVFLRFAKLPETENATKLKDEREKVKLATLGREEMNAFSRATNGNGASAFKPSEDDGRADEGRRQTCPMSSGTRLSST